jgi:phosphatidate cytidylyltransferase
MRYTNNFGVFLVVLVFVISWVSDTAAFAVGSLIGKHKLIPEVSPKKTVEGAIGGVVFSALLCPLYGLGLDLIIENIQVNYLYLFLFGLVLSVVSQFGDLMASLIKREYGVKDYGRIFPGHGGVLDRFDSVIAVSTILMILSTVLPPFAIL